MFTSQTSIEKLTTEVLIDITSFLNVTSILQLSLTSKAFSHLIKDELVFKRLAERDYHVTEKEPDQSWLELYKQRSSTVAEPQVTNTTQEEQQAIVEDVVMETVEQDIPASVTTETEDQPCPHLEQLSDSVNEIKRIIYKSGHTSLCDLCLSQTGAYLNMSDNCHNEACRSCLENNNLQDGQHFPIQLELSTGNLYCFECNQDRSPLKLINSEKVDNIVEYITAPESSDDLDKRRKAEHQLYVQELRREDMSLKHYLVEKQWGRTWMLFRTREGSPLPGKITNNKLARSNGTLDPNIRLPMDKFRPAPETHGDIVSEKLWSYLVKAYGVQGRAYSEDDIVAPEYARLRVYVDDFKKSIHLYP
ncbi:hypothetical protein BDF21DRAFT_429381 [Thamnidium elegans]|nr:hypothetical protein BDF21DRAFT_429381 [Thamnidium elegans]